MSSVFCRDCGKEINEAAPLCPHCGAPTNIVQLVRKSQTVAASLCLFLGGLGGHRFYLGPTWAGITYLLLCWTGIPSLIAIVETFLITFAGQDTWANKYNNGILTPPTHLAIKILALLIPLLMLGGVAMSLLGDISESVPE
ncbi:MAG: NINE protein [Magnetococcales bacterium]|nr:NINE protein [Magnetococcales bacterium]